MHCKLLFKRFCAIVSNPTWIDIRKIKYKANFDLVHFSSFKSLPSDWDKRVVSFDPYNTDDPKFVSIYRRFTSEVRWADTPLFEHYKSVIGGGSTVKGFSDIWELEKYYQRKYDELFRKIECEGLVAPDLTRPKITPLFIHVDRKGNVVWTSEGNHRLAMAVVIGLDTIPVFYYWTHRGEIS